MKKYAWIMVAGLFLLAGVVPPACQRAGVTLAQTPPYQETVTPEPPPMLRVESLGAFATENGAAAGFYLIGDTLRCVYTDGVQTWTEERAPSREIASLALTVCGTRAWVFVVAPDGETETVAFELQSAFPCARMAVIYLPLALGE